MYGDTAPELRLKIERLPQMTIVRCTGKVMIETWPLFSTTVRDLIPEGKLIRVDLSEVELVDSTGIGAFVSVWASAKKSGCDLKFTKPNKRVQDVVEITRLQDLFEHEGVASE
jgi:anti-anti-sigma factor